MFRSIATVSAVTAALIISSAQQAQAAWVFQSNEDAFSEEQTHVAMGMSSPYALGFRCSDADDLTMIYMTPEQVDGETLETLTVFEPELLVRVDSDEVVRLPASLEEAQDGSLLAIVSADELTTLASASAGALPWRLRH